MKESTSVYSRSSVYAKPTWGHNAEFILSCMAMSIGLGNFWRFPYICYENGGGAFLIPYFIVIVLIGRPMYYLDLAMGQYSGKASIHMYYKLMPGLVGIGITQVITCMMVISYYAYVAAIVIFYLVHSFQYPLPWDKCEPSWGNSCIQGDESRHNRSGISSAEFFLNKVVLKRADNVDHGIGLPDWRLIACLGGIWSIAFLNIMFGIKSFGKIVYFTALFPYVVLITLLIKSLTLPGSLDGILFFITPVWSKLFLPRVWLDAITQCFFSLNVGCGTISMYASYNNIHSNIALVSLLIAVVDSATSFTCGLTIFSGLGNLAKRLDVEIEDVYQGSSMALGFVSYPDAISKFGTAPYVFAICFFLMFFTLGLGGLCAYLQVITTNILELWGMLRPWEVAAMVTLYGFLTGIIYTTPGGGVVFDMVDMYGNVLALTVLALLQAVSITYIYGLHKWCWNMQYMVRRKVNIYWRISWAISCPLLLIVVYAYSSTQIQSLKYNKKPVPCIAQVSAYVLFFTVISPIILSPFIAYCKIRRGTETNREACALLFSSAKWLPEDTVTADKLKAFVAAKEDSYKYKDSSRAKKIMSATFMKLQ